MKLHLQNMWHYYIFRTYSVYIKNYNWNKLGIFIHVIAISWQLKYKTFIHYGKQLLNKNYLKSRAKVKWPISTVFSMIASK